MRFHIFCWLGLLSSKTLFKARKSASKLSCGYRKVVSVSCNVNLFTGLFKTLHLAFLRMKDSRESMIPSVFYLWPSLSVIRYYLLEEAEFIGGHLRDCLLQSSLWPNDSYFSHRQSIVTPAQSPSHLITASAQSSGSYVNQVQVRIRLLCELEKQAFCPMYFWHSEANIE